MIIRISRKVQNGLSGIWNFTLGHIFGWLYYDKKYLTGQYFVGRWGGLCAIGWKWVVRDGFSRMFLKSNVGVPWPVSSKVAISCPENIEFDNDDLHVFHTFGAYFQAIDAKIVIGKGTWIAPNVGLITANHDSANPDSHVKGKSIILGKQCWVGMNAVILPGVVLGDRTTVGAGAIVTKSFEEGYCVIAGNPARIIKKLVLNI